MRFKELFIKSAIQAGRQLFNEWSESYLKDQKKPPPKPRPKKPKNEEKT